MIKHKLNERSLALREHRYALVLLSIEFMVNLLGKF